MYHEFFNFKKSPFNKAPDPDFLFPSPGHKEAAASVFHGVHDRKGFIALTGEPGVGKTTLLWSYLDGIDPEQTRVVYLFNSVLSFEKLLKQICSGLGVKAGREDPDELVEVIINHLIEEYGRGRNAVLIIDEAQNMPVETLERLQVLSYPETSRGKLMQIVLVGRPQLEARLNSPPLRRLNRRIAVRLRIPPLTDEESFSYIQHRLMKASSFHNMVFTRKALLRIARKAGGVPRAINILCDKALAVAFEYQCKAVDERIVSEVIADLQGGRGLSGFDWKRVWRHSITAVLPWRSWKHDASGAPSSAGAIEALRT